VDIHLLNFDRVAVLLERVELLEVALQLHGLVQRLQEVVNLTGVDEGEVVHLVAEVVEVLQGLLLHLPQLISDDAALLLDGHELVVVDL
jgi:hypothetical protein